MKKRFDKNLFIIMFSLMVGFVIITFFIADVVHQTQIQQLNSEHTSEIETIEENNIYFTTSFLESSVLLDSAREDRAFGNYHFDLAHLFYTTALSQKNETIMQENKDNCISNCTFALPKYQFASMNFQLASSFFEATKNYTKYDSYMNLLTLYVNLSNSGYKLTILRYNATQYLRILAESMEYHDTGVIQTIDNLTEIMDLFTQSMGDYEEALQEYEDILDEIDEYDIEGFSPIRVLS